MGGLSSPYSSSFMGDKEMRNSIVFEKKIGYGVYIAKPANEELEICSSGMLKWFDIDSKLPKYERFRLTVRRKKFPHSFKVDVDFLYNEISKTEEDLFTSVYLPLLRWLKGRYPKLIRYQRYTFYARIEWLKPRKTKK